ncbi:hypothetical protein Acr_00g0033690 [Actinidia rufa]|uniref:Retrotransposon Copia-like N-terminal domain-containing protein n=1 Tax=Actinidia rufa TaxID=165716 RepID=A0A7J0DFQ9_9ERIC|nr:hypothetical protein Acr_00g0033690 [Actinidia rufa]
MEESIVVAEQSQGENSVMADLASRMTQMLNQTQNQTQSPSYKPTVQISVKLNGTNYALWSQVVEMFISSKDKLGYINEEFPQPQETDPGCKKWRIENVGVKGWLINSMDPSLIGNFIRFPTAKAVWDNIATTYFDGTDTSQVYGLKRQVMRLKQGGRIYRSILQQSSSIQEDRVYIFLDGLDDRLDKIRGDMLQIRPFPTVEQAYAHIRREDIRQVVMMTKGDTTPGASHALEGRTETTAALFAADGVR